MLYFLDDIIQEIIVWQSHNLFFFPSEEISDHETLSQIVMHLYFKASSHGCSLLANVVSSPKQPEREHLMKEKGRKMC